MAEKTDASKTDPPVTLEHIHADLHDMKMGAVWYFIFSVGVSVFSIGMALLIRSLTKVALLPAAIVVVLGLIVMTGVWWFSRKKVK